jgi:threonine/homoserine/homoserine lactone efflux protein
MQTSFLIKGIIIGFSIAAPVGPIGILCIRRSLQGGTLSGLLTGLGAATADACYGCVAGFGLTFISSLLISHKIWLQLIGGIFLCYLGIGTFYKRDAQQQAVSRFQGYWLDYVSTFFLTLTNPMTIMAFAAIFAGLGIATATDGYASSASLVFGVFMGSALWWILLTAGVGQFKDKFNTTFRKWMNRISGCILLFFGLWSISALVFETYL